MHIDVNKKDLKELYNQLKASAKKRNIEFTLTMVDLYELSFPILCPILKIPLFFNRGMVKDDSISIDRIDSSKGYSSDNIIVISYKANRLKSDASFEELDKISKFYNQLG